MLLANFLSTKGKAMMKVFQRGQSGMRWYISRRFDFRVRITSQDRESKKRINEANALHLPEDLHHETVTHARHLCRSTLVWGLCTVSGVTHGQVWWQLFGAGSFRLAAEWRGDRKQPWQRRFGLYRQKQRPEGDRRRWAEPVEGPASAEQRTFPLQTESWWQQPGQRAQRCPPGPEHTHPEEGYDEVYGGTGVPAMLGSLRQFALLVKAQRQTTTTSFLPCTNLWHNPKTYVSIYLNYSISEK